MFKTGHVIYYFCCDLTDYCTIPQANAEFVYYTGDIISHRVWDTSVDGNQQALTLIYDLLDKYFGNATVLPVLGNHEPHPLNV